MNKLSRLLMISVLPFVFAHITACTLFKLEIPAAKYATPAAKLEPSQEAAEPAATQPAEPDKAASLFTDSEANTVYGAVLAVVGVGITVGVRYLTKRKAK